MRRSQGRERPESEETAVHIVSAHEFGNLARAVRISGDGGQEGRHLAPTEKSSETRVNLLAVFLPTPSRQLSMLLLPRPYAWRSGTALKAAGRREARGGAPHSRNPLTTNACACSC